MSRQTAFITGASKGIGKALTQALLERGWRVIALARHTEPLDALTQTYGDHCRPVAVDVRDAAALQDAVRTHIAAPAQSVHLLFPSAGLAHVGAFEAMPPEAWRAMIEVNLTGLIQTVQLVLPHMADGGHIVIPGSIAGATGFANWAVYSATKFGVRGFAEALRNEVRPRGIHVTHLTLGATATPLWEAVPGAWDRRNMLTPEEVAAWILHILDHPQSGVEDLRLLPPKGVL
ncbi:hypothetical protein ARMA_2212 [Ardenticatena maritima]|uniref:Short-chain dehydrogenase n=1 Tax=Ardenticatena maritima TaxID=872965 RepID=A0A0M8KAI3_9CHLR|nr:SDR family oxidoreductase [Ardenticatena maritima]KPL89129.1 hypothetical protein SE16_00970 [Ardenticatena maritima]GAP63789.1 hypothetical protein ARMA_2212 [Ardenticatena maritima]